MARQETPFENIEGALEYVGSLLEASVLTIKQPFRP